MPQVQLVGATQFTAPDVPWTTDASGGQALAEFAGRACYQSWSKPVPATSTNAGYLNHILQVGHLSVLEHSSATFYITGVSRAVAHEMVRHRHLSISELSQRHQPDADVVVPPPIAADPELSALFATATSAARQAYFALLAGLEAKLAHAPNATLDRKQARQAARAVLTHATPTAMVVTGNFRAWRHFVGMRASDAADAEIRRLAVLILRELQQLAPNVFADFRISQLGDGSDVAASPLVGEGLTYRTVCLARSGIGNVESMSHRTVAQRERAALADLFDKVGPDQPTLDEGWLTSDLLQHVIIRERRPDVLVAQVIKPLKFWSDRVTAEIAALPWAEQVQIFRSGPPSISPLRLAKVDSAVNTAEYFIHHEDVRRGVPGWTVRDLDAETTQAVTDQVRGAFSKLQLKKLKLGVQAQLPDRRTFQIILGDPAITLVGAPSELLLWISGRRTACEVEVQGSPAALEMIAEA